MGHNNSPQLPEEKTYNDAVQNLTPEERQRIERDPLDHAGDSAAVLEGKRRYRALQELGHGVVDLRTDQK